MSDKHKKQKKSMEYKCEVFHFEYKKLCQMNNNYVQKPWTLSCSA